MSERLEYLARRVGEDGFFLASAFITYAHSNALDDARLAQFLGCPVAILAPLRLCRRPAGASTMFHAEVTRIADRFGLEGTRLAQLIRWADAVAGLRAASAADLEQDERGVLLAARDRETEGTDPPDEADPVNENGRGRS